MHAFVQAVANERNLLRNRAPETRRPWRTDGRRRRSLGRRRGSSGGSVHACARVIWHSRRQATNGMAWHAPAKFLHIIYGTKHTALDEVGWRQTTPVYVHSWGRTNERARCENTRESMQLHGLTFTIHHHQFTSSYRIVQNLHLRETAPSLSVQHHFFALVNVIPMSALHALYYKQISFRSRPPDCRFC